MVPCLRTGGDSPIWLAVFTVRRLENRAVEDCRGIGPRVSSLLVGGRRSLSIKTNQETNSIILLEYMEGVQRFAW